MTNPDNRADCIRAVINAYLDLPDTPAEPSSRDFRIATDLIDDGYDLKHILCAIKIGFVRRWARDHSAGPLPNIRSLSYFRTVLEGLSDAEFMDDYVLFLDYKYAEIRRDPHAWVKRQMQAIGDSNGNLDAHIENRAR